MRDRISRVKRVLVTGGCGFIGSHLCRLIISETSAELVNLDALTYAGDTAHVADIADDPRYTFVHGSILDTSLLAEVFGAGFDVVFHLAAESHVDNSIQHPALFAEVNMLGTQHMLDAARKANVSRFVQVSTDEVYGSLSESAPPSTEEAPLMPNSPYSASKAGADFLARAAFVTHGQNVVITRCSNNFGTHQQKEKFIPRSISQLLSGKNVPLMGDGQHIRDWISVEDHCRGILAAALKGKAGEIYNLSAQCEHTNRHVAECICDILSLPKSRIEKVPDRPGHDRRYALDATKAKQALSWKAATGFYSQLERTVMWYRTNV